MAGVSPRSMGRAGQDVHPLHHQKCVSAAITGARLLRAWHLTEIPKPCASDMLRVWFFDSFLFFLIQIPQG